MGVRNHRNHLWIAAKKIHIGQSLYSLGENVKLVNVSKSKTKHRVYNLTVQDNHNYFVGNDKILVHNISVCEKTARAIASNIPNTCKQLRRCKDFARKMEEVLLKKGVKGKRICIKTSGSLPVYSKKYGSLSDLGSDHVAIQVGDLVFDNMSNTGIPYSEWFHDLGLNLGDSGGAYYKTWTEDIGSKKGCL